MEIDIDGIEPGPFVGRGSHGVVYRSKEAALDRTVAVKVVGLPDEAARGRFSDEQAAMGRLSNHPGIVTVYSSGVTPAGDGYLVMEWMAGGSLRDHIARGPLGWEAAAAIGVRLAHALAASHEAGVVHGDVKPANVLFGADDAPKLADFGLARLGEVNRLEGFTSAFAAPEVQTGNPPTRSSDVFSLGRTIAAMAWGVSRRPGEPPADTVPDGLVDLVKAATASDPSVRPTAADLAMGLDALLAEETIRDRPLAPVSIGRRWRAAGMICGALAVLAVFYATTVGSSPTTADSLVLPTLPPPASTGAPTSQATEAPPTTAGPGPTTTTTPFGRTETSLVDGFAVTAIFVGEDMPWSPTTLDGYVYVAVQSVLAALDPETGGLVEAWDLSGESTHPPLSHGGRIYQPISRRECYANGCFEQAYLEVLEPASGGTMLVRLSVEGRPETPVPIPTDPWCEVVSRRNTLDNGVDCSADLGAFLLWVRVGDALTFVATGRTPGVVAHLYEDWYSDPVVGGSDVVVTRPDLHACLDGAIGEGPVTISPSCVRGDVTDLPADRLLLRTGPGASSLGTVRLTDPYQGEGPQTSGQGIGNGFVDYFGGRDVSFIIVGRVADLGPMDQLSRHLHVAPDGAVWVLSHRSEAFRIDLSDLLADPEAAIRVGPCPTGRGFTECVRADRGATALMAGDTLLIPNAGDNAVHGLDTATGRVGFVVPIGGDPGTPVAWAGVPWAADTEGGAVVRLDGEPVRVRIVCGQAACPPSPEAQLWEHRPLGSDHGLWIPWFGYLVRVADQP